MGSIVRGKIIRDDVALWDGKNATATRVDATSGTITGLQLNDFVDVLQVFGNGTARTVGTIDSAISFIGTSTDVTLMFSPGTWTIDSNLTIPSNFTVYVPAGAIFDVSNGITLTISGPVVREVVSWTSGSGTVTSNDLIPLGVIGTSNRSYQIGTYHNTIDSTVTGSLIFDGTAVYPNKLGVDETAPVDDPVTGARTNDTNYVAGGADVSAILAGYDNVLNSQAGMIAGQHSMIYTGADHSSIYGGSLNTIEANAVYAAITGGTSNTIEEDCDYAVIIGGDQNIAETGASDAAAGFRAVLLGGSQNVAGGRDAVIVAGNGCRIDSTYGTILAGESVTLNTDADHAVAAGNGITMGAGGSADYSTALGLDHTVDASRCFAVGEGHTIAANHTYSSAMGIDCTTPANGTHVFSARQRDGTAGRNQGIYWTASQETTDTTTTRLSISGSANYPTQPNDSVVNGTVYVVGVRESDGVESSFHIDFTSRRVGSGTPTLTYNSTTTRNNGLSLGTVPTMNATSGGVYRVQVVGLAATNINWDAVFYGHQIVYTA